MRIEYLRCKKAFNRRLHFLEYEDEAIRRTIASAELDKNEYWKILKRNRTSSPLFDIFRVTLMFGMMGMAVCMAYGTHSYSKGM